MEIFDFVLGNLEDEVWKARLGDAKIDFLELSQWDAQKNRFRKKTQSGRLMAVSLERGQSLRDGDILDWNEKERCAVACRIRLCPVMAVDMSGLQGLPAEEALASAVKLGHALGNQHWPMVVMGGMVYVPVTTDSRVMGAVMDTHAIDGVNYIFMAGEDVSRLLEEQDARRLFGGAEQPGSGHDHHAPSGYFGFYQAAQEAMGGGCGAGDSPSCGRDDFLRGPHGKRQRGRRHQQYDEA